MARLSSSTRFTEQGDLVEKTWHCGIAAMVNYLRPEVVVPLSTSEFCMFFLLQFV